MGSKSSDIIIAVMGVTGSGKSTFISQLTGQEVPIGHGLRSLYKYCHPVYGNIHLIDTPEFDDTVTSDTDVLKNIAAFMSESYKKGTLLTGVVYMHKITDNRVSGSSQRSINMFKKLCGDDSFKHVVLTTSMWGEGDADAAKIDRETGLKEDKRFWGLMQSGGSKVMRWLNNRPSASAIVEHLLESSQMHGLTTLQIQRELVEENRDLEETSAGQEVGRELLKERMKMLQEVEDLKKDHENALLAKDSENAEKFRKDKQEMESKLQKAEEAQKALRIDLEQLLREKTEEYEIKQKELRDQMAQADHLATKRGKELEKLNKDLKQSKITYQELRREFAADLRRQEELERKVEKSKSRKKLLKALIPSMFGVGMIGLGIATANPLLMMSGGALASGAAAGGAASIS